MSKLKRDGCGKNRVTTPSPLKAERAAQKAANKASELREREKKQVAPKKAMIKARSQANEKYSN